MAWIKQKFLEKNVWGKLNMNIQVFKLLISGMELNQFSSVAQSCLTLCNPMDCSMPGFPVRHQFPTTVAKTLQSCPTLWDPMDCSTLGFLVKHQLQWFTQTHVHWVSDAIQPSDTLSSPSPPAFNLSQYQGLFQWVSSLHQVATVLEFPVNTQDRSEEHTSELQSR